MLKSKYDEVSAAKKAEEGKLKTMISALEARIGAAEGRSAAVDEQEASAREEASEWKWKYDVAVADTKASLERAAIAQEHY